MLNPRHSASAGVTQSGPSKLGASPRVPGPTRKSAPDKVPKRAVSLHVNPNDPANQISSVPLTDETFISTDPLIIDTTRAKLTPIAIAFLLAELVAKRNFNSAGVAREYCAYVSAALEGVRCEFWIKRGEQWHCVNTSVGISDQNPGLYRESLSSVEFLPQTTPQGTVITPVVFNQADDDVIGGALIFGGPGVEHISVDSVQSYSIIAKGLAKACIDAS